MPQSIHSDEHLVERASRGDKRALAAIYKRYHQDLFRYCAALLGNPEDAGDALQNTMVKVLGALPGERRRLHLKPWLYRIAHNESVELLRRRRDLDPIEPEALVGAEGPEASAETRERLRCLIADLRELPERQRGSLVMRELGGLSFEQIGSAFETTAAVARQTVYEARIGLQEMEKGRAMGCDEMRHKLSDGDRRVFRRRDVRAHLRECRDCREFEQAVSRRRTDLAAISPLPALAAVGLLKGVLGGAVAGSASGAAGSIGAGGGAISASAVAKTVATVVVAGAIGVSAADRAGLVHVLRGSSGGAAVAPSGERHPAGAAEPTVGRGSAGEVTGPARAGAGAIPAAGSKEPGAGKVGAAPQGPVPQGGGAAKPDRDGASGGAGAGHGHAYGKVAAKGKGAGSANAHGANPQANGANAGANGGSKGKAVAHGPQSPSPGNASGPGQAKAPRDEGLTPPEEEPESKAPTGHSSSSSPGQSPGAAEAEAGDGWASGKPEG